MILTQDELYLVERILREFAQYNETHSRASSKRDVVIKFSIPELVLIPALHSKIVLELLDRSRRAAVLSIAARDSTV